MRASADGVGRRRRAAFDELKTSVDGVGVAFNDAAQFFKVLGAVVNLGNVAFEDRGATRRGHRRGRRGPRGGRASTSTAPCWRRRSRPTSSRRWARGRRPSPCLDGAAASDNRHTLAKELYRRLFDWVVRHLNGTINYVGDHANLGILDIYGFEILATNDLEQFFINYTNEMLQQFFIELTIKEEQAEYDKEGILGAHRVLRQRARRRARRGEAGPCSRSSTSSAPGRVAGPPRVEPGAVLCPHAHFVPKERLRAGKTVFGVKHYAGDVAYDCRNFIDKNRDTLYQDLVDVVLEAGNGVAKTLFLDRRATPGDKGQRAPPTIEAVQDADPRVARRAGTLPAALRPVPRALENVRDAAGYCFRDTFENFHRRYLLVAEATWNRRGVDLSPADRCRAILAGGKPATIAHFDLGLPRSRTKKTRLRAGATKVFVKDPTCLFALETARTQALPAVVAWVQKEVRRKRQRTIFGDRREGHDPSDAATYNAVALRRRAIRAAVLATAAARRAIARKNFDQTFRDFGKPLIRWRARRDGRPARSPSPGSFEGAQDERRRVRRVCGKGAAPYYEIEKFSHNHLNPVGEAIKCKTVHLRYADGALSWTDGGVFSKQGFKVGAVAGITGQDRAAPRRRRQLAYHNGAFVSKEKLAFSASSPKSVAKNDAFGFSFREGCTLGVDYDSGKKDKDGALGPASAWKRKAPGAGAPWPKSKAALDRKQE
ncbi:hypothetical protein JL720_12714 [Aureococcus anophagefferens]|nr:hypothetical protein JL720_12714 [Aureococcus anophagefferens]